MTLFCNSAARSEILVIIICVINVTAIIVALSAIWWGVSYCQYKALAAPHI